MEIKLPNVDKKLLTNPFLAPKKQTIRVNTTMQTSIIGPVMEESKFIVTSIYTFVLIIIPLKTYFFNDLEKSINKNYLSIIKVIKQVKRTLYNEY